MRSGARHDEESEQPLCTPLPSQARSELFFSPLRIVATTHLEELRAEHTLRIRLQH